MNNVKNALSLPQSPVRAHSQLDLPDWRVARNCIMPFLEPVSAGSGAVVPVIAERPFDTLSGMVTDCIKMTLSLFYRGMVIPLSDALIHEWAIGMASVRLAMEENIARIARSTRFELHASGSATYYSVHTDLAPFNSILPFYVPFQESTAALLGSPYYFAVPERRTVIVFGRETLPNYVRDLRDDIHLTYETSTRALSPELIEVSESGLIPIYR
jgi:hypothetical protein